ncbi:MAG: hypothetical protein ABJA49_16335, partial [Betaproteobacteria bacterium]
TPIEAVALFTASPKVVSVDMIEQGLRRIVDGLVSMPDRLTQLLRPATLRASSPNGARHDGS